MAAIAPTKQQIDEKKTYVLSGKKLKDMLTPANWIHGAAGDIAVNENADGSIEIGLATQQFAYMIVNGELRACMIPITFIADPNV